MENEISVKIISQKDLMESGCFDVSEAIKIIEDAFLEYLEGRVIFPDKVSTIFEEKSQNRINCLPAAVLKKHVYGMKWVSVFPENPLQTADGKAPDRAIDGSRLNPPCCVLSFPEITLSHPHTQPVLYWSSRDL